MPPLILLALAGTGLYAGWKLFAALTEQAGRENTVDKEKRRRAAARTNGPKDLGELEWDEKAGVYRPKSGA
jgi:hypothetical protein